MGIFSQKGTQNQSRPSYTSLQVQTSCYGLCIPVVYGNDRIAPNLIWYGDFKAKAHEQQQPGKGGGGGGSSTTTYTYYASFALGLCEGPLQPAP